jgi:hypothetical protein
MEKMKVEYPALVLDAMRRAAGHEGGPDSSISPLVADAMDRRACWRAQMTGSGRTDGVLPGESLIADARKRATAAKAQSD